MQPALFDSSVYISALRQGNSAALALGRLAAETPLWLSSVVLEELYAGAGGQERKVLERLERDFDRAKRILVPNLSWHSTALRSASQCHQGTARVTPRLCHCANHIQQPALLLHCCAMKPARSFASDNNAGIHPDVLKAIAQANAGHVVGYGDDPYTASAVRKFKQHFG